VVAVVELAQGRALSAAAVVVALAFTVVLVNAANFLDNTDGVAVAVCGLGLLAASGGAGAFACAGYAFLGILPLNWPRPILYPGDGGALPLGLLLAAAALERATVTGPALDWRALAAPAAIPLLDFCQVVAARLWLGYAPWVADRRHLTHVAIALGVPAVLVMPTLVVLGAVAWAVLR
jgi:UDP-GlcNAc:undecaprenyl-phosphate GlcNAc-1-phosphate transferase